MNGTEKQVKYANDLIKKYEAKHMDKINKVKDLFERTPEAKFEELASKMNMSKEEYIKAAMQSRGCYEAYLSLYSDDASEIIESIKELLDVEKLY